MGGIFGGGPSRPSAPPPAPAAPVVQKPPKVQTLAETRADKLEASPIGKKRRRGRAKARTLASLGTEENSILGD